MTARNSPEWHLTAHFFRAMFDFGILSTAGSDSFKHMLLGGIGGFLAFGFLVTYLYAGKYAMLWGGSPEFYRHAVLGDDLLLIGLPMLLASFVTLLVSDSLFPDERDFRILGTLPVRKNIVFGTKLAALTLFTSLFIAVIHISLLPLMLLTSINPFGDRAVLSRATVWAMTSLGASLFAVFSVTAVVGLFVLVLSRSRLNELIGIVRSAMLLALVLCVPIVLRLPNFGAAFAAGAGWFRFVPPAWFVGLQQVLRGKDDPWFSSLAGMAVIAVLVVATMVGTIYTVLFRQFERLMMRSAATSHTRPAADRASAVETARVLDADEPPGRRAGWPPAFRAVKQFIVLTLRRSQLHQSVLVGLSACGAGIAMNGLIGANLPAWLWEGGPPPSALAGAAVWMPFGFMFVCGLGVRAALALPMEHRANWIFRLTEADSTRRDQMRAVDQAVTACVVGVPVAAATPVMWIALGPKAVIAAIVVALVGLVIVHAVLLDWHRIPFTCSYLPGKRFVAHSLVLGFAAYTLLTLTGVLLVRAATAGAMQGAVILAALSLAAWYLRRRRLAAWTETPLMFEDEFPDQPQQLLL